MTNNKIHEGRNVKRFREMLQIKQEALAYDLGEDWNQKKISMLEAKETIAPALLQEISSVLKIPVEAFQNFDEETAIVNIQNNYEGANKGATNVASYQRNDNCSFNPIDKMVELYERMLQQQKEMIERLEKLMEERK